MNQNLISAFVIEPTRSIPPGQTSSLQTMGLKCYSKLRLCMFQPKNKTESNFLVISGSSVHLLTDAVIFLVNNASITRFKFVNRRPRDNKIIWNLNLSILVPSGSFCLIQNHFLKKQNIPTFSGNQKYNKTKSNRKFIRMIYIFFSLFCLPTWLPNLCLMRMKLLLYIDNV